MKLKNTSQIAQDPTKEKRREEFLRIFKNTSIKNDELMVNFGLFIRSGALAKILFLDELYKLIINKPGVIMEFGVWYGQTLAIFENLRAIYEPYNYLRKIIGFDTFNGYLGNSKKDNNLSNLSKSSYSINKDYLSELSKILSFHESENPMSHINKHELVKGDVSKTLPLWLKDNPANVIALAYLDLALYIPTKNVLKNIQKKIIPGSVIVLDEFNNDLYPGATEATMDSINFDKFEIKSSSILKDRTILIKK